MKRIALLLTAAVLMTGCSADTPTVSDESTVHATAETTASEITTTSLRITESAVSTQPVSAEKPSVDFNGFSLDDYCGEFDPAKPIYYDVFDGLVQHEVDPEITSLALGALKQSDIFAEVTAKAKELFTVQNGALIPTGDSFLNEGYEKYISFSEGIAVNPRLVNNIKMGDEGHIIAFAMPLAESLLEWSGTSTCIVVVYVSPDNKAQVLSEVSGQTLSRIKILRYADKSYYAVFGRGHTDGTAREFIVGFADGAAHIEYSGSVLEFPQRGTVLMETGFNITMLLVKTEEHGWCYVGSVPLSEEAAEILFADDDVIRACPDIAEKYEQGEVSVFGGKYIAVGGGFNEVYTLENGALVPCEFKNLIGANGMDESIDFRNINLN